MDDYVKRIDNLEEEFYTYYRYFRLFDADFFEPAPEILYDIEDHVNQLKRLIGDLQKEVSID